jgi:hypothetical protein
VGKPIDKPQNSHGKPHGALFQSLTEFAHENTVFKRNAMSLLGSVTPGLFGKRISLGSVMPSP